MSLFWVILIIEYLSMAFIIAKWINENEHEASTTESLLIGIAWGAWAPFWVVYNVFRGFMNN